MTMGRSAMVLTYFTLVTSLIGIRGVRLNQGKTISSGRHRETQLPIPDSPNSSMASHLRFFYAATGGEQWRNKSNWLSGDPCNHHWFGVTCGPGNISDLQLVDNSLSGVIPSEIGGLRCRSLDFRYNALHNEIPSQLGLVTEAVYLGLRANELRGEIPSELAYPRDELLKSINSLNVVSLMALGGGFGPRSVERATILPPDIRTGQLLDTRG